MESEISVDPKHHRYFVARRGGVLRQIADEYGGVTVSFPRSGVTSDRVVLKGSKDCVEGAKKRILEIVADLVGGGPSGSLSCYFRVWSCSFQLFSIPGGTGERGVHHSTEVPPHGHGQQGLPRAGDHS